MQTKNYYGQYTKYNTRVQPDSREGLWIISSRFLQRRVEVPLWLSWLNTNVSKQTQAYVNLSTSIYQAYIDKGNISMQDIKTSERQRQSNRNTGELFRCLSTLALCPHLQYYEGFPLESIPPDHSVSQHLQGVHTRTFGPTCPLTCSRKKNTRKRASLPRPHLYKELSLELETTRTFKSASSK